MLGLELIQIPEADRELAELISTAPPLSLGTPKICRDTTAKVESTIRRLGLAGGATEAGLWLLAGDLDRSHAISQELHDANGSYWHGIMHRAEGDYWNAKYWMRRASKHPIRNLLVRHIETNASQLVQPINSTQSGFESVLEQLNSPETVAEKLIDLVERDVTKQTGPTELLRMICWWEWQLLFQHSLNR